MNLFFICPNKVKIWKMQRQVDLGDYKDTIGDLKANKNNKK